MKRLLQLSIIFICVGVFYAQQPANTVSSPNKNIVVTCDIAKAVYNILYKIIYECIGPRKGYKYVILLD